MTAYRVTNILTDSALGRALPSAVQSAIDEGVINLCETCLSVEGEGQAPPASWLVHDLPSGRLRWQLMADGKFKTQYPATYEHITSAVSGVYVDTGERS